MGRARDEEAARRAAAALRELGMVPLRGGAIAPADPRERVAAELFHEDEVLPFLRAVDREHLVVRARTRLTSAGTYEVPWAPRWAALLAPAWAQSGQRGGWLEAARDAEETSEALEAVLSMYSFGGARAVSVWAEALHREHALAADAARRLSAPARPDLRDLGGRMSPWANGLGGADPVGSVSTHFLGDHDVDPDLVERASRQLGGYLPRARAGANGWGPADAEELERLVAALDEYAARVRAEVDGGA